MHGVGGNTVEEAQQRISYSEYLDWCSYVSKNGSLNPAKRLEKTLALIAATFANALFKKSNGKQFELADFELFGSEDIDGSPEDVFNLLKGIAVKE